ncbi:hypothetical protein HDU93_005970, partial [Gonapodya sp. JEL0774]
MTVENKAIALRSFPRGWVKPEDFSVVNEPPVDLSASAEELLSDGDVSVPNTANYGTGADLPSDVRLMIARDYLFDPKGRGRYGKDFGIVHSSRLTNLTFGLMQHSNEIFNLR